MKIIITSMLTVCFLFQGGMSAAQGRGTAEFEYRVYEFGQVPEEGGLVVAKFPYKNTGQDSLSITQVEVGCGCTTPNWPKAALAVGDSAFITTAFDPKGRVGEFEKNLVVYSDGKPSIIALTITGTVMAKPKTPDERYPVKIGNLRMSAPTLEMGKVLRDGSASKSLTIYNAGKRDIAILVEQLNLPSFLTLDYLEKDTLAPGETAKITVSLYASDIDDWGFVFYYWDLVTDDHSRPAKRINVTASISERFPEEMDSLARVHFDKTEVDFGEVKPNTESTATFTLTNIGDATLKIHKAKASCGCTTASPEKMVLAPGESTEVSVVFQSGTRFGANTKYLTIICNDPNQPETNLKIQARVKGENE